jgi:hypothetical protein
MLHEKGPEIDTKKVSPLGLDEVQQSSGSSHKLATTGANMVQLNHFKALLTSLDPETLEGLLKEITSQPVVTIR